MVRFTVLNINNYINNCIIYFFLVIVIIVLFLTSYDKIYSMDFFQRYIFNNVFVYRYDNEDGNFAKNIIDNQLKVANNFTILDNYIGQNGNIEDDNKNNEEKNIEKQNKEYVISIKPELIEIKNKTTYEIDINNLLSQKLNILQNNLIPTILIIHTHGSESYLYQEHTDYYRNEDIDCNVIRVGHELYTQLTALGYKVIHDTRLYDYPTYSGSYTRSLSSVQEYLINDKNIQIVFDIHRDAMASKVP